MKEGDCLNDPRTEELGPDAAEVYSLPAVPYSQAHTYEVFESYTLKDGGFPGDASVEPTAESVCDDEFEVYIGTAYDDSQLDIYYLMPTKVSWNKGRDREVTCLALDPDQMTSERSRAPSAENRRCGTMTT